MLKYVIRRLIDSISTLFFIIVANFILFRLMPGDPIQLMVSTHRLTQSMIANLNKLYA